ncbi:hypothetical protein [Streptomyces sp. NPDC056323]|uniref:hypothetical protein n=1 Tax=unclassified Streptomyces TaxID=2593676 RepID=UPI0035E0E148
MACAEHASGSQFVEVGQALSGESAEKVGQGGADAGHGSVGAGAKGTADGHAGHAGHRTGSASPTTPAAGLPYKQGVGAAAGIALQEQRVGPGLRWWGLWLAYVGPWSGLWSGRACSPG